MGLCDRVAVCGPSKAVIEFFVVGLKDCKGLNFVFVVLFVSMHVSLSVAKVVLEYCVCLCEGGSACFLWVCVNKWFVVK